MNVSSERCRCFEVLWRPGLLGSEEAGKASEGVMDVGVGMVGLERKGLGCLVDERLEELMN